MLSLPLERALVISIFQFVTAVTRDSLPRTALDIAVNNVKLSLNHAAIATWLTIRTPILGFLTVTDSFALHTADDIRRLQLSRLDLLRPAFDHPLAIANDELLLHMRAPALTMELTRAAPRASNISETESSSRRRV